MIAQIDVVGLSMWVYLVLYFVLALGFSYKAGRLLSVYECPIWGYFLGGISALFASFVAGAPPSVMPLLGAILGALIDYRYRGNSRNNGKKLSGM